MVVISPKDIAASGWLFTLCNYRDLCREASSSSTVPLKQDGTVLSDVSYTLSGMRKREQASVAIGFGWDKRNSSFEIRAQQSISPMSTVIRGQNLVVGLHYTYYLPKKAPKKKVGTEE